MQSRSLGDVERIPAVGGGVGVGPAVIISQRLQETTVGVELGHEPWCREPSVAVFDVGCEYGLPFLLILAIVLTAIIIIIVVILVVIVIVI